MKTLEDVNRVINAGKPDRVVQVFIEEYLTGVALAPFIKAEEEYAVLKATPDTPDIEAVVGVAGEIIIPAASPNTERDTRIAELEAQYPHLVEPGGEEVSDVASRRPEPVLDLAEYKRLWLKQQLSKFDPEKVTVNLSLGFSMDARRADIGDMERLRNKLLAADLPGTLIRGADDMFYNISTEDLQVIIDEQVEHGWSLYKTKWFVEQSIAAATSAEEITTITWKGTRCE